MDLPAYGLTGPPDVLFDAHYTAFLKNLTALNIKCVLVAGNS
jgi:hypothetical protein